MGAIISSEALVNRLQEYADLLSRKPNYRVRNRHYFSLNILDIVERTSWLSS
jgi:hypothetical protein